jgi:phage terminase large subunit-like protein
VATEFRSLTDQELSSLSDEDLADYEENLEALYWARGKDSFLDFCQMVDVPGAPMGDDEEGKFFPTRVKPAAHHRLIIDAIQGLADGRDSDVDGVMFFLPPGAAKSTYASVLAPAWLLGRKPGTNVIAASYGQDLANRFGRRVRYIVRSQDFTKITGFSITGDNQAVHEWSLTNGSDYRATGLDAGFAGTRSDFFFIDDPHRNRDEADSTIIQEKIWEGFNDNVQTRLKPGGKIFLIQTRWNELDLAGRLLGPWSGQSGLWRGTDGRLWKIINLPLLAEHIDDPLKREKDQLLWPEWFRMKDALRLRDTAKRGGSAARTWSSLFQQRPAPSEGAILARHYWKPWVKKDLPECESINLFYDTAFDDGEENDFSAMTAWGVFEHKSEKKTGEEYNHKHIILLGAWNEKVSAPDLLDEVRGHCKLFHPDRILIEKRASGIQLIQELQRQRFPVKAWLPKGKPGTKGKVPRAHAIAAIMEQGSCWYVPGAKTDMVLDQCAAFPFGTNDDLCDTVTMAISWYRDKFIFRTADDELDSEELKERLAEQAAIKSRGRRLYGSNERQGLVNDPIEPDEISRMTESTKRRLYG